MYLVLRCLGAILVFLIVGLISFVALNVAYAVGYVAVPLFALYHTISYIDSTKFKGKL